MARTAKGEAVGKRVVVRKGKVRAAAEKGGLSPAAAEAEGVAKPRERAPSAVEVAAGRAGAMGDGSLAGLAMVETGGLSPLAYLLRVMRDETETPARRMDAAKTAAPFVHPKLATMDVQSAGLDRMGDALAELIERAQGDGGGVGGLLGR